MLHYGLARRRNWRRRFARLSYGVRRPNWSPHTRIRIDEDSKWVLTSFICLRFCSELYKFKCSYPLFFNFFPLLRNAEYPDMVSQAAFKTI